MVVFLGILYGLLAASSAVLIGLVLYKKTREPLNRSFAYFLGALVVWMLLNYVSNLTALHGDTQLTINRALLGFSSLLMGTLLIFCSELLELRKRAGIQTIATLSSVLVGLFALTPFVVASVASQQNNVVAINFGTGSLVYFLAIFLMALSVFVMLFSALRQSDRVKRRRAIIMMSSLSITVLFVMITNVVATFIFNDFTFSLFGPLFAIVLLAGTGYAIIRHKLFDVRTFAARLTAYTLAITSAVVLYTVVVFGVVERLFNLPQSELAVRITYIVIALLLALTYRPLKHFFDKLTNRIFFQDAYDTKTVLDEVSSVLVRAVATNMLIEQSLKILRDSLKVDSIVTIVGDVEREDEWRAVGVGENIPDLQRLTQELNQYSYKLLTIDDMEDQPHYLYQLMQGANVEIISRLETSKEPIGYLFFGHKESGRVYSDQDIQLIRIVSDELAIAIQNAMRFEEIKRFNETLQAEVQDATAELRTSNKKLHEIDESKDEFISMASHQLRTPLTSVKGYLSMVLDGDVGKISDEQRKVLEEAYNSSQRMVYLIGDFLNVSRLQTGKFELEYAPTNLVEVLGSELDQLRTMASSRQLKLEYSPPADFPTISLDQNKFRQVMMNFIDNAIYYSPANSTITITLTRDANDAIFKVIDHGIGVPADERHKLFTKFYRASNARKQRPDGTGIGLFMAQKVIVAHGGSVIFESTEGQGSTFGFRVPLQPPVPSKDDTKQLDEQPDTDAADS